LEKDIWRRIFGEGYLEKDIWRRIFGQGYLEVGELKQSE
jgi:hypothetical protein